jgi:hypothetical protein
MNTVAEVERAALPLQELAWLRWRQRVVAVIREHFGEILNEVGDEDIDWESWRPLFEAGHSPKAAVEAAFLRAL